LPKLFAFFGPGHDVGHLFRGDEQVRSLLQSIWIG
jgi:hypothetical protein